jgi:DNA-binding transcriptional ArsR family regulator
MALFRGQPVPPGASAQSLDQLRQFLTDLTAAELPDHRRWEAFLDEAGCEELAQVGQALARDKRRRTEVLDRLGRFAQSPDWNRRDSAARLLGALGDQRAIPILHELLSDPEGLVRYAALKGLWALGAIRAQDQIKELLTDPSPIVKETAASFQSALGGQSPTVKPRDRSRTTALSQEVRDLSSCLKLLSDSTRLEILLILSEGEQPTPALGAQMNQSQPAVSHHLALLRHGGFITPDRQGRTTSYRLTETGRRWADLVESLAGLVRQQEGAQDRVIRRAARESKSVSR